VFSLRFSFLCSSSLKSCRRDVCSSFGEYELRMDGNWEGRWRFLRTICAVGKLWDNKNILLKIIIISSIMFLSSWWVHFIIISCFYFIIPSVNNTCRLVIISQSSIQYMAFLEKYTVADLEKEFIGSVTFEGGLIYSVKTQHCTPFLAS
jgi:hypothetical protein